MGPRLTTGSGGMIGAEDDHGKRRENVPETDHGQRRGQGATPAAFYLGLCRLCGILSPPASATVILQAGQTLLLQRWCCRRAVLSCSSEGAASIRKSGPEIKNRFTLEGVNREKHASIRKSGPEIKNRCTLALRLRSAGETILCCCKEI